MCLGDLDNFSISHPTLHEHVWKGQNFKEKNRVTLGPVKSGIWYSLKAKCIFLISLQVYF